MTRDQEAFFGMALKVKNFNVKNSSNMVGVPALAGYYTQLSALITDLIAADTGSRADLTGYAIAKGNTREKLENLAMKLSNALASYSVVNDDVVLQKRAGFPKSFWYSCSEEELVTQATIIKNLAQPLIASLTDFGASAADFTSLETNLSTFTDVISDPTLAIDQRKEDNDRMVELIDEIRTLLSSKLDVLMRSFEVNSNSLYALYRSARAIDINGSVQAPTSSADAAPQSITTMHKALAYDADTFYTLQNLGAMPVFFSLSTALDTEGEERVLLNPGETRSRLAENLAPTGTLLQVKNDSDAPVKIRIWVE